MDVAVARFALTPTLWELFTYSVNAIQPAEVKFLYRRGEVSIHVISEESEPCRAIFLFHRTLSLYNISEF